MSVLLYGFFCWKETNDEQTPVHQLEPTLLVTKFPSYSTSTGSSIFPTKKLQAWGHLTPTFFMYFLVYNTYHGCHTYIYWDYTSTESTSWPTEKCREWSCHASLTPPRTTLSSGSSRRLILFLSHVLLFPLGYRHPHSPLVGHRITSTLWMYIFSLRASRSLGRISRTFFYCFRRAW